MFGLFDKKKLTPEEFWRWFVDNKLKLEKFIDSEHNDYSIYNKLTEQIKKYNEYLFPELTKTENNNYVLIITPDGIKDGIEPTKKLAESSPEISNWVIKKFRQPTDDIGLNFNGVEYPASDIEILPQLVPEEEKVDINIFIRNMDKDKKNYQTLAFLYLDHILGEFNSITKVRYIDFHHLDMGKTVKNSISLLQLRNLIEEELY
jgi:hypothetical protein